MRPVTVTIGDEGIVDCDFVQWILNEIEDPKMGRKEVAHTYAILIPKGHRDFSAINKAILNRWGPSGFKWIKEQAWKRINAKQ